jgi:Zn-dependent peptidase ImmA (M78 family)
MNRNKQIDIEKIAESVRRECNITGYGIKDIFEVSEKLGYRTIRYPIGAEAFLGFAMIRASERIVFSNSSLILSREIFTVAHEIGHQKLHLSEQGRTIIKDDNFFESNDLEAEANYFAACLLMPRENIEKFIRLELKDKDVVNWDGLDIARIQTAFNVSYDMTLIRLMALNILNDTLKEKLEKDKIEQTATKLLRVVGCNTDLCKAANVKKVPAEFLEWVISNYNDKLIPKTSLATALKYVDLSPDDVNIHDDTDDNDDEESFDEVLRRMD